MAADRLKSFVPAFSLKILSYPFSPRLELWPILVEKLYSGPFLHIHQKFIFWLTTQHLLCLSKKEERSPIPPRSFLSQLRSPGHETTASIGRLWEGRKGARCRGHGALCNDTGGEFLGFLISSRAPQAGCCGNLHPGTGTDRKSSRKSCSHSQRLRREWPEIHLGNNIWPTPTKHEQTECPAAWGERAAVCSTPPHKPRRPVPTRGVSAGSCQSWAPTSPQQQRDLTRWAGHWAPGLSSPSVSERPRGELTVPLTEQRHSSVCQPSVSPLPVAAEPSRELILHSWLKAMRQCRLVSHFHWAGVSGAQQKAEHTHPARPCAKPQQEDCLPKIEGKLDPESHNVISKWPLYDTKLIIPKTRKITTEMRKDNRCQHLTESDVRIIWQGF